MNFLDPADYLAAGLRAWLPIKRTAVVGWLLERRENAPEVILAMGDGQNDIEMLVMAGICGR